MLAPSLWFSGIRIAARIAQRISHRRRAGSAPRHACELLETRVLLSTFAVVNLNNQGPGSLRQAILNANQSAGPDRIIFQTAGSIRLTTGALPVITDIVDIDATTAPGFQGSPVVEINNSGFGGLKFSASAGGSALRSLGVVNAIDSGVTVTGGGHNLFTGNYFGLRLDGVTPGGSLQDGVRLVGSVGDTIGGTTARDRNVIAGNRNNGINLNGTRDTVVLGNYIGTDRTGLVDRGNTFSGIQVTGGSSGVVIGGAAGNVISGNDAYGVLINGNSHHNEVSANLIGLNSAGNAPLGNQFDGVKLQSTSHNLIGHADPVTSVDYYDANEVTPAIGTWNGIRAADEPGDFLITGQSRDGDGLLFLGTIEGQGQTYPVNIQTSELTEVFGVENLSGDQVGLAGLMVPPPQGSNPSRPQGFLAEGTPAALALGTASYQFVDFPGADATIMRSRMGGLAVGNYLEAVQGFLLNGIIGSFLYDITTQQILDTIAYPGALHTVVSGIWQNATNTSDGTTYDYTISGEWSHSPLGLLDQPTGHAFLVDYDSTTGVFSNWTTFVNPQSPSSATQFLDLSAPEKGVYTIAGNTAINGETQASLVTIRRETSGLFSAPQWFDLAPPGNTHGASTRSAFGNVAVGTGLTGEGEAPFQVQINSAFQLSNVISGNGLNGIALYGATDNLISMNFVGTDARGLVDLGNRVNGVLVSSGSSRNLIGGEATGGNNPTQNKFVRPPQGNLISGNNAHGVLINNGSTANQLSGNYIGTDAHGLTPIANSGDGVAIEFANGNSLIGCREPQDPFVFFNVIGGNQGNGLRVFNSNHTTIQANFFGLGSDNNTPLGNAGNGVVIEGNSTTTTFGGVIPLGNVVATNRQNGIVVRDWASDFLSFNTFAGTAAFTLNSHLGNGRDGFLITTAGGGVRLRTNVISSNGDDGVDVSGLAHDVQIVQNLIGTNTEGFLPFGNGDNGVEVSGLAHDIVIGGAQPQYSVAPRNVISGNNGYGVAFLGATYNNRLDFSYIGADVTGTYAIANGKSGVYLGPGVHGITIGSADPDHLTLISGNRGNGVEINGAWGNTVFGTYIGVTVDGVGALPNLGSGVLIRNGFDNVIGTGPGGANVPNGGLANTIAFNGAYGVAVESGNRNGIHQNSLFSNTLAGIWLAPGANWNQTAPVLTAFAPTIGGSQISGRLTSRPLTSFTLEFFASDDNMPSGKRYLGSLRVTTNIFGVATFTFFGPLVAGGRYLTATATDPWNNTSAFSNALAVPGNPA